MDYQLHKKAALYIYVVAYLACVFFLWHNRMLLSQYDPVFFNVNHDITELTIVLTGLPKFMTAHPVWFFICDAFFIMVPVIVLAVFILTKRFVVWLGIVLTIFCGCYFLLGNIFIQYHPEPYVVFVFFLLLFATNKSENFYLILSFCRYYLLYIFVSAAVWKIARGALLNPFEMTNILLTQHADVLAPGCDSWSCNLLSYLIGHHQLSYCIYLLAAILEMIFIVGYFTSRFDKILFICLIAFLVGDQIVMRIPYWSILFAGFPLLINFDKQSLLRTLFYRRARDV